MRVSAYIAGILLSGSVLMMGFTASAAEEPRLLVHLKTSLKHDDAQICVAYNAIWAALEEGLEVDVLIDADAVYTYRIGLFGHDGIETYKLPETMRQTLARDFKIPLEAIPRTYGHYLSMLRDKGAEFYINEEMLITAGISEGPGDLERISAKFLKPVTLPQLIRLRLSADAYLVY
jgi:hypothetical protein